MEMAAAEQQLMEQEVERDMFTLDDYGVDGWFEKGRV